jgi:hypothetical protein
MVISRRSKKMASDTSLSDLFSPAMGPKLGPKLDRRQLVAAFGVATLMGLPAWPAFGQQPSGIAVRARTTDLALGSATVKAFALDPPLLGTFQRNDQLTVDFQNELPVAAVPRWRIGVPELAALSALAPVAPQGRTRVTLPLRQSGTQLLDLGLGEAGPLPLAAFVVAEPPDIVVADRDEIWIIEEWRLGKAGLIAPGSAADDASAVFTVNRRLLAGLTVSSGEVLRLRLVNASPRSIVALKIENHGVEVIAIDGQPCERFPARDGELMLAPGARIDVLVNASNAPESTSSILLHDGREARPIAQIAYGKNTVARRASLTSRPLPSNGLPDKIDLQRALRVSLAFDGTATDWIAPTNLTSLGADVFRVKRGRAVVLTLANRATTPAIFHLHGHHARLLDRLDDGWKPFWLDTVTIAAGQTQRIAFVAETAGSWLIEAMLAQWSAPRLARRFTVEA